MTMTDRGELERLRAENARLKMIIDDYRLMRTSRRGKDKEVGK